MDKLNSILSNYLLKSANPFFDEEGLTNKTVSYQKLADTYHNTDSYIGLDYIEDRDGWSYYKSPNLEYNSYVTIFLAQTIKIAVTSMILMSG